MPASALSRRSAPTLLAAARAGLAEAALTSSIPQRYASAHLAALRAAAAVLAVRARPVPGRGRSASAWTLLGLVAPELQEWATFFAAGARKRAAAEAGLAHTISLREADDLLRGAEEFTAVVEAALGFTRQSTLMLPPV